MFPVLRAVPPVIPPVTTGVEYVKVVPETTGLVVKVWFTVWPLQIVFKASTPDGVGFTVIITVKVVPKQPVGPVGVMV